MAKRTRRRNKRYSHKRNSNKRRVSKRRVSKKTYKRKNMRGGSGDYIISNLLKNPTYKTTYKTTYDSMETEFKDIIVQTLNGNDSETVKEILKNFLGMKTGHALNLLKTYNEIKGKLPPGGGAVAAPASAPAPAPAPMTDEESLARSMGISVARLRKLRDEHAEARSGGVGYQPASLGDMPPEPEPEPYPVVSVVPPAMREDSKIIYEILKRQDLLKYYDYLVDNKGYGYSDDNMVYEDFIKDLVKDLNRDDYKEIVRHSDRIRIRQAFEEYISQREVEKRQAEEQAIVDHSLKTMVNPGPAASVGIPGGVGAVAPASAPSGFGAATLAPSAVTFCPQCRIKPIATGFRHCSRTCATAAKAPPAAGGLGAAALPASGFGAGAAAAVVDSYIGYPGKNMCINCLKKPKRPPHQFCGKWCAGQLSEKKGRFMIAGGTELGDLSDNPADYPYQDSRILNGKSPVPQGQPDYDKERYIYFYENDKNYKEFSNFHPCPSLVINGVQFPTSEHYFQCAKFKGSKFTECTQTFGEGARAVFNFARDNQSSVIDGWYGKSSFTGIFYPWWPDYKPNLKDLEMYKAVYHKFTQDEYLKHLLLFTGDKIIVEHAYPDDYWGDRNFQLRQKQWNLGDSENHLGQILMLVRMDINYNNQHLPDVIARQGILTM